jgi:hypothetical protein
MTRILCPDARGPLLTRRSALLGLTTAFTLGGTSLALDGKMFV